MNIWFQKSKFVFLFNTSPVCTDMVEGYYLLAGSAKLKTPCHTPSSLPFESDGNNIFPKCNEMGELVWTDVLCQWLPLLTHKNSNLMLWTEGATMLPFSFENNFHWNSHHYCVYLAKFWYEWLIKWAPLFCFGPDFSRSILKIVKLQAVFWDQVH